MTAHRIRSTPAAAESIRHVHPPLKRALRQAIRGLPRDPPQGRPLALELAGFRSLRVSRYRVIYRIQDRAIEIHPVGPRRDIYEVFRRLLDNPHTYSAAEVRRTFRRNASFPADCDFPSQVSPQFRKPQYPGRRGLAG
jgi:mRNA-degrading endonuclease RelE of RelBE toxin-antitoxin system